MRKSHIFLVLGVAIFGIWIVYPRIAEAIDPNSIRGTVRRTAVDQGYVILFLSLNHPSDGVAIPISEFIDDVIVAAASGDSGEAVARIFKLGSQYIGEEIVAKGKLAEQSDGSRIIGVKSLKDIHVVE